MKSKPKKVGKKREKILITRIVLERTADMESGCMVFEDEKGNRYSLESEDYVHNQFRPLAIRDITE